LQNRKHVIYSYIGLIAFSWMFHSFPGVPGTQTVCFAQEPATPPIIKPVPVNPQIPLLPGQKSPEIQPGEQPVMPAAKSENLPQQSQTPALARPDQAKPPQSTMPGGAAPLPGGQLPNMQPAPFIPGPSIPAMASQQGMVTLNFDDADVFAIIQTIFGNVLKVNYVVDPRIKGRVTFRAVAPVPFDKVLPLMEVILRLNGIGVVEENSLYRLVPIGDISREPSPVNFGRDPRKIVVKGKALLQVAPILYMSSAEAIKLLSPFSSSNAILIDVPKSNQIIIVDTDTNVKRLLQLIEVFDNEKMKITGPQVFVYSVHNGKAKDIASILQQTFQGARSPATPGAGAAAGQASPPAVSGMGGHASSSPPTSSGGQMLVAEFTKFIPDEVTNSIIILSTPEEFLMIKAAIDKIDIIPRQVIIEGLIAQVTLTDNLSLGLAPWIRGTIGKYSVGGGVGGAALSGVDVTQPAGTGLNLYGIDDVGNLKILITSLATDSRAKLLATPHILVSDNREAKIQVGQQVPLVTSETYASTTVAPQRTIQYRDIGIILKVKPRVNEGGLVALELYQEVSTYETVKLFSNESQIILNKNDATTSVVVQDGQTIVIGGLIREDTTKSSSGIPFLTKIPFIGWIFGNWTDNKQRTEIIILLTPRVVKDQTQANTVTNEYIDNMADESKGRINKKELLKEKKNPQSKEP
jgi:type II secretory pathway component GspD/PulD (secretin)